MRGRQARENKALVLPQGVLGRGDPMELVSQWEGSGESRPLAENHGPQRPAFGGGLRPRALWRATGVPGSLVPGGSDAQPSKPDCTCARWACAPRGPAQLARQGGARAPSAGCTAEDSHWRARHQQPLRPRCKPAPWNTLSPVGAALTPMWHPGLCCPQGTHTDLRPTSFTFPCRHGTGSLVPSGFVLTGEPDPHPWGIGLGLSEPPFWGLCPT